MDKDLLMQQTHLMYEDLRALELYQHARDFWRIRAAKQQQQLNENPVFHEHTAIKQYMLWHNQLGVRLPSFLREGECCLAHQCKNKKSVM